MVYIYGFLIIASIIFSIVIFSGKRLLFKYNYFYSLLFLMIVSGPMNAAMKDPQENYMYIGITVLIFLPLYIFFIFIRKHTYLIENVKVSNLIDIITKYFYSKNIECEVQEKEIYIPKYDKSIDISGNMELTLDLKEIKKLDFYEELLEYIKLEIKNINKRSFPYIGITYLIYAGVLYWLMNFIK